MLIGIVLILLAVITISVIIYFATKKGTPAPIKTTAPTETTAPNVLPQEVLNNPTIKDVVGTNNVFTDVGVNNTPSTLDNVGDCGTSTLRSVDNFGHIGGTNTRAVFMNVKTKEECLEKCNTIAGGCAGYKFNSSLCCNERGAGNANCQVYTKNGISGPVGDGSSTSPWLVCAPSI